MDGRGVGKLLGHIGTHETIMLSEWWDECVDEVEGDSDA